MRINVIPVIELSDIHLRAEYREILMAPHYYRKSKNSSKGIQRDVISPTYTLNKGHAMMWYNKMGYIVNRYTELHKEMIYRGFKVHREYRLNTTDILTEDFNDYIPTLKDKKVNAKRILDRIKTAYEDGRHYQHKYLGRDVPLEFWETTYNIYLCE